MIFIMIEGQKHSGTLVCYMLHILRLQKSGVQIPAKKKRIYIKAKGHDVNSPIIGPGHQDFKVLTVT